MVSIRCLLFALLLIGTLVDCAKRGSGICKHCIKNKIGHHNQRLIASPINLLNPDRYEFFTLNDKGDVVKRIMTFKEIQSIVAGSDISELKLFANTNNNDRIVSSVVSNVRHVLNNELNLMHGHDGADHTPAELPISEMINVQDEPAMSSMEYTQDNFAEDSTELAAEKTVTKTTERTTPTQMEKISERPTVQLIESLTNRWTSNATERPTNGTTEAEIERSTIRQTMNSTERTPAQSTLRPTESSTIRTTTARQKVQSTVKPAERSTTEEPKVRPTPEPITLKTTEKPTERSTVRSTTSLAMSSPVSATEPTQRTTGQLVKLPTIHPSTTMEQPTEKPMLKLAEHTTTHKPADTPVTNKSAPTVRPTEEPVVIETETPLASPAELSTEKSSEQSMDYSTLRSEEASNVSSMEYSTEESSEKVYDQSKEITEEKAIELSTVGLKISETTTNSEMKTSTIKPTESSKVTVTTAVTRNPIVSSSTPAPTEYKTVSSTTKISTAEPLTVVEALKDLLALGNGDDNDSNEEILTTTGFNALLKDPVTHYVTMGHKVQTSYGNDEPSTISDAKPTTLYDRPDMTTLDTYALEETIPTTTSLEMDVSTMEDSTGYGSEETAEMQQPTFIFSSHETTATVADVTYKPSQTDSDLSIDTTMPDSSTIPSDAQHAIHKIIESLQSLNGDSLSDESEEDMLKETSYPIDVSGLNYDTDAQSSINAIIQSLGQGALVSDENSMISATTEFLTTTEEVPNTTTREAAKTTVSTSSTTATKTTITTSSTAVPNAQMLKVETLADDAETGPSSSSLNYNTSIMDTIEKFLSKFASLPSEETYSMNLTKIDVLSNYPSAINMTDYVDRTATVASVLKFPQTRPVMLEYPDESGIEEKQREELPSRPQSPTTQSLLNETVASFMKLGEMLTMNNRVNTVEPPEAAQLELKTAVDEEESEFLRFLSICGNLGTTMYDYLTGPLLDESMEGRSLVYSPFATITTLSMLFLGTRGTTAESINGVIGLDEMTSFNPHQFFKSVAEDLKPKQRRTVISTIDGSNDERGSFFSRTLLSDASRGGLQRFFKARIQEIYSAVAQTVDFRQKDTLLKHLSGDFPRDYVDTLKQLRSPLVSISRNRYRHECNAATTYGMMSFAESSSNTIPIPSVTFRSGFSTGFSKALDAAILSLPGSTSNVSVFFLKPSASASLANLETHIRTQSVANVLKLFPDETVRAAYTEVQLPYFTQTTIYNMSRSIQELGLQNLFQPNVANFNGLQDSAVSNLHLSETIQTDSFTLCGSGDGVGRTLPFRSFSTNLLKHMPSDKQLNSVSSHRLVRRNRRKLLFRDRSVSGALSAQDNKLVFDTPFLYLVRHNPTGLVLYMGRFVGNNSEK